MPPKAKAVKQAERSKSRGKSPLEEKKKGAKDKTARSLSKKEAEFVKDVSKGKPRNKSSTKETQKEERKRSQSKGAKQEDKPDPSHKPKRALTAYTIFNTEFVKEVKSKGTKIEGSAFGMASAKWQTMTDAEKEPYNDQNVQEKARVERQTAELAKKGYFTMTDGTKSTDPENADKFKEKKTKKTAATKAGKGGAKAKQAKESDSDSEDEKEKKPEHPPPKRALTSWTLFLTSYSAELRAAGTAQKDCFRLGGEKWAAMTDAEKKPYTDQSAGLKKLAEKQTKELADKGFYTLADGTKSTDEVNAELLKVKTKRPKKDKDGDEAPKKKKVAIKRKSRLSGGVAKFKPGNDSEEIDLNADSSDE